MDAIAHRTRMSVLRATRSEQSGQLQDENAVDRDQPLTADAEATAHGGNEQSQDHLRTDDTATIAHNGSKQSHHEDE